jgi:hypothetical protein
VPSPQPTPKSPLASRTTWLNRYRFGLRISEVGRVVSVGDGIVWIEVCLLRRSKRSWRSKMGAVRSSFIWPLSAWAPSS